MRTDGYTPETLDVWTRMVRGGACAHCSPLSRLSSLRQGTGCGFVVTLKDFGHTLYHIKDLFQQNYAWTYVRLFMKIRFKETMLAFPMCWAE